MSVVILAILMSSALSTSSEHTPLRTRFRSSRQAPSDWCKLPRQPEHGLYTFRQSDDVIVSSTGIYLPDGYTISYTCDSNYGTNNTYPDSVCEDGEWTNPLDCIKMCEPLVSNKLDIECEYGGWDVPCNKSMWPKTRATAKCKGGGGGRPPGLYCKSDGEWDKPLPVCSLECGISFDPETYTTLIVGGSTTRQGEFPWLAALYLQSLSDTPLWVQKCGGTLISPKIILTAAHCLVLTNGQVKPTEIKVGLGKYLRDYYKYENDSVIVDVGEVVTPVGYGGVSGGYALDIGLLALVERVRITPYVRPACVDWTSSLAPHTGDIGHVAGWGTTENKTSSEKILSANLTYLGNSVCKNQVKLAYQVFITEDKFCAGTTQGSQVNKGDSGGGMTVMKGEQHYVVGVVSSKISQETSFSLFTNVLHRIHRQWLKQQMELLDAQGF